MLVELAMSFRIIHFQDNRGWYFLLQCEIAALKMFDNSMSCFNFTEVLRFS